MSKEPTAPNMRTFSLNSDEAYAVLCPPPDPHVWGPPLPRDPRPLSQEVIVEPSEGKGTRR